LGICSAHDLDNRKSIAVAIQKGMCQAVSDGSFKMKGEWQHGYYKRFGYRGRIHWQDYHPRNSQQTMFIQKQIRRPVQYHHDGGTALQVLQHFPRGYFNSM